MRKKVTLKDIAKEIGVDPSTVSKALRKSSDISVAMQDKIKRIADKMGYRPNLLAKSLISKRSNILGVIIPDLRISFFSEATRGIYEAATKHGFESILLVHDENPENERRKLEFLSDINVDGILLNAVNETTNLDLYKRLHGEGIKIVCWDRKIENSKFNSVTIDDKRAGFELTNKMIQAGRRKIMFIGPNRGIPVAKDRFDGYLMALEMNDIPIDEKLVLETRRTFESSHNVLYRALQNGADIDAVVCMGGLVAFGAGNAILESNYNIPGDIILGEFGDNHIISRLGIPFYSVNQNPYEMGEKAVNLLIDCLNEEKECTNSIHVEVEHEIIYRNVGVQRIKPDDRNLERKHKK
ncbi:MAG: LacI family DNA-binding transcriptional regulator [Deferribacteres bacterium]|nr:LacI family DNA-binding transcriptional regulator [candidate division KSB1 bacterium]MCB9501593.1 LacI family DNA-binding transcriptional regulator [Deferribacteres bacterium]